MKLITIPTLADVHVHLREPGGTQKEDFESGTKAAIAGGYTQILDMPNNIPPTITTYNLSKKGKLAKDKIWCDVGFHFGASISSIKYFKSVRKRVFALKVYMNQTTGTLLIDSDRDREQIFKAWQNLQPIMVHAEGETVEVAISLAKKFKRKLHICHVSADQIPSIKKAKKDGLSISCEVCPHHLFLSTKSISRLGNFAIMKPPLPTEKEREKLWNMLNDIDMIATDHAPHTISEKLDQSSPKYGVPGLETTLPLMLWALQRRLISQKKLVQMLSGNPRRIFNIPRQENTYLDVDIAKKYKIGKKKLFTKCQWTPFKFLDGVGEIKRVVLRGRTVYEGGEFSKKPDGQIIQPVI